MMKYEYGVEYPCYGEKPDLPDDVKIKWISGDTNGWVPKGAHATTVGKLNWQGADCLPVSKFRIVDERYKPKSGWFERGELPPVGEVVIAIDKRVDSEGNKCELRYISADICVLYDIYDDIEFAVNSCHVEFRPLRTERDETVAAAEATIEEGQCLPANSMHLEILYDAGMLTKPTK